MHPDCDKSNNRVFYKKTTFSVDLRIWVLLMIASNCSFFVKTKMASSVQRRIRVLHQDYDIKKTTYSICMYLTIIFEKKATSSGQFVWWPLQDSRLWSFVSLRPEISGLNIPSIDFLIQIIHHRYPSIHRFSHPDHITGRAVSYIRATCSNKKITNKTYF